jgi:hypothetical protein
VHKDAIEEKIRYERQVFVHKNATEDRHSRDRFLCIKTQQNIRYERQVFVHKDAIEDQI